MISELSYNFWIVTIGTALLCAMSAFIGTFSVLRKRGLLGDVIAHSVLPGIGLAFLITGTKDPWWLFTGAVVTGWLSTVAVDAITRYSKIKSDAAIAIVLSVFFGAGIVILTYIQHLGMPNQSGLETYLFGQAAAMSKQQVTLFLLMSGVVFTLGFLFKRSFVLLAFDEEYARSIGWPVWLMKWVLSALTVASVALGVQAVGVVLMAALLITPAAGARFFTSSMNRILGISIGFGLIAGISGAVFSAWKSGLSTGPVVVVFLTIFTLLSLVFGPEKGVLRKWLKQRRNQLNMHRDHVLKAIYYYRQEHDSGPIDKKHLLQTSRLTSASLEKGIAQLRKEGLIKGKVHLDLNETGERASREIIRKHRLWELYLSTYFHLPAHTVHDDAEGIEHLITPEIEEKLAHMLNNPNTDPHNSEIPYE
jgi:manganese/zinc/iron transport system permease protein